jgi:hypothetical protein
MSFVIADPNIINKPYDGLVTQKEFTQMLIYIVSLLSNKMTFTETPIRGLDDICEFLNIDNRSFKRMLIKYSIPAAEFNGDLYSTKERLSTWMNHVIDKHPCNRIIPETNRKRSIWELEAKIAQLKETRKFIVNKTDFCKEQLDYFDDKIKALEKRIERITIALAKRRAEVEAYKTKRALERIAAEKEILEE